MRACQEDRSGILDVCMSCHTWQAPARVEAAIHLGKGSAGKPTVVGEGGREGREGVCLRC